MQVGPQVTNLRDPLAHRSQRERLWSHAPALYFIPRTRRGDRRRRLRPHRVRRRIRRADLVASRVDEDAAGTIGFVELLREMRRIATHRLPADRVREARGNGPIGLAIEWDHDVKALR